jgi:hypothetical protein
VFRPGLVIAVENDLAVVLEDDGELVGLLWYSHRDDDFVYSRCTLGRHFTTVPELDRAEWREITPDLLRRLSDNWNVVLNLAHAWLANDLAEENRLQQALDRRGQRGGRGVGTDFYKGIALEYRRLYEQQPGPTSTIARRRGVHRSTASRWVRRARELGYLGPAMPRRAGEARTEDGTPS